MATEWDGSFPWIFNEGILEINDNGGKFMSGWHLDVGGMDVPPALTELWDLLAERYPVYHVNRTKVQFD
jgi:hypothetical protein